MKLSLFVFFLLSALAVASGVLETTNVLEDRAPKIAGGSRVKTPKTSHTRTKTKSTKSTKSKSTKSKSTKSKSTKSKSTKSKSTKSKSGTSKSGNSKSASKIHSSAAAAATNYICGAKTCGSKSSKKGKRACSVSGSKKKTSRAIAPVLTRRTLETVSNGNTYVREQCIKHKATELDYNYPIGHVYAVSKHGSFANKPQVVPLTGLEGCTGIAVVSEKGYWISHFMEYAMDGDNTEHKTLWGHLIKDVTNGKTGKYTPPHTLTDIFSSDSKPVIYVSRPKHNGAKLYTPLINEIMAQIKKGTLASATMKEFDYTKMMGDKEKNTVGETTARGKMLIEYTNDQKKNDQTQSPQQAMYRVWLEDQAYPETWAALSSQQGTASEETKEEEKLEAEYREHCLTDTAKTIAKDDESAIIEAICNKASLDVSSPITATHGKTQIKLSMSASQKGCHASPTTKKLMRTYCKRVVTKALEACPNPAGGFLGNKPLIWNGKGLGCLDVNVYAE